MLKNRRGNWPKECVWPEPHWNGEGSSWEVDPDPVVFVRGIIEYEFVNENLLRQAFTRRAFAVQYGIEGCSEELEFLGDSVLNVLTTRVIVRQLMWTDVGGALQGEAQRI